MSDVGSRREKDRRHTSSSDYEVLETRARKTVMVIFISGLLGEKREKKSEDRRKKRTAKRPRGEQRGGERGGERERTENLFLS